MNNPLISVIVPIYKVEEYLDQCVKSIINQTYTNLEIILVDDGSPDRCPEMCDEYAKQDSRVKVIHKENGGLSSARNVGIIQSKGDYIGFVDSDDYIAPDMYEKLLQAFSNPKIAISCCLFNRVQGTNISVHNPFEYKENTIISNSDYLMFFLQDRIPGHVTLKLYKKDILLSILFVEDRKNEDDLHSFYVGKWLAKEQKNLLLISEPLYYYRNTPNSIVNNSNSLVELDVLKNLEEMRLSANDYPELIEIIKSKYSATLFQLCVRTCCKYGQEQGRIYLRNIDREIWRKWGVRHRIAYFIIAYVPFLWNINLIVSFCLKNGNRPRF